ncbi:MAG: hypothetical protein WCO25_04155 [Candidatus Uhrbacteria bacterium]
MKIDTSERIALQTHGLVPVGMPVGLNGDVAALRREFFAAKLHLRLVGADGEPVKPLSIPVGTMREMLAAHNATADASVSALAAGVQASIATPVEPEAVAPVAIVEAPVEPEPASSCASSEATEDKPTVDELPPLADDVYAAPKPAAPARPSLSDVRKRLADKARASQSTIVSRPSAPVSRPAPAPMPERVPGVGEFYCSACPKKHVIAAKDAWVHSPAWLEIRFEGRPPSFLELSELAVCTQTTKVDRRLNWYPMLDVSGQIQRWVAEQAERDAAKALADTKRNLGGTAGRILAPKASKPEAARCVASTGPSKPRSGPRTEGFGPLADWKPPTVK